MKKIKDSFMPFIVWLILALLADVILVVIEEIVRQITGKDIAQTLYISMLGAFMSFWLIFVLAEYETRKK